MIAVAVFGAIMAMLLAVVVVAPIIEEGRRSKPQTGDEAALRLERALDALRRLQFDYETGKLDEEDYAELRGEYAAAAISARDELASRAPQDGQAQAESDGAVVGPANCSACGTMLAPSVQFCTHCGIPAPQQVGESAK